MSDKYNEQYFSKRDYLDLNIANSIAILMRDKGFKKVLDVGCGTGKLVQFLNKEGFHAYGCDNAYIAIETAKKINRKSAIIRAAATKLPFKKGSFDMLTAISVIEHLTERECEQFLKEAYRVLKPHRFIFLITPNFASPLRYLLGKKWFGYSDPTHINFFTPLSLANLLKNYGFYKPKFWFKTDARKGSLRNFINYLLFSTPFCFVRDSFGISARKATN